MSQPLVIPFVPDAHDNGNVPSAAARVSVENANWSQSYPYVPKTEVSLWHDGNNLYVHYEVEEEFVRALRDKDNADVHNDSCVEFFISNDDDKGYYNFEATCIGTLMLSHREGRKTNVIYAPQNVLESVKRFPSLGKEKIEGFAPSSPWSLTLIIPKEAFFLSDLKTLRGIEARCNFYKCGDELPTPHFVSWKKIETDNPDFHRPEFFAPVIFE